MAIDSRDKRAGAVMMGIPFIVIAPLADGTIGSADRQHIAHVYPGVLASEAADTGVVRHGTMMTERMDRMVLMPY